MSVTLPPAPPPRPPAPPDRPASPSPMPPPRVSRRWPPLLATGVVAAVLAAVITAAITAQVTSPREAAPVTVTASPAPPPAPVALPADQANRETCQSWDTAKEKIAAAVAAQQVIPEDLTILDDPVRENPEWSAAVQTAGELYGQAGDALAVAPGTTLILDQATHAAADALATLSTAVKAFDPSTADASAMYYKATDTMNGLCERLAPA